MLCKSNDDFARPKTNENTASGPDLPISYVG